MKTEYDGAERRPTPVFMDGAFLHAGRLACFPPSPSLCPACSPSPSPWSYPPCWRLVLTPRKARASGLTSLSLVYGRFMAAWAVTGMSTTLPKGMPARKAPDLQRLTAPTYPGEPFGEARRATLLRCGPHVQVGRHRRFKSGEARGAGYHSISSQSSEAQVCARPGRGCSVQLSQL